VPADLPAPAPDTNPETEPFWSATAEGRLLLAVCDDCGTVIWYPRLFCPACASQSVSWTEASGDGTVFTFTVVHRSMGRFHDSAPYVVAYVELAEGPRVMTNIIDCEPDAVYIGQPVHVVFCDTGEGSALYRFAPVAP
jgi:uncharacterized OB-fold protein